MDSAPWDPDVPNPRFTVKLLVTSPPAENSSWWGSGQFAKKWKLPQSQQEETDAIRKSNVLPVDHLEDILAQKKHQQQADFSQGKPLTYEADILPTAGEIEACEQHRQKQAQQNACQSNWMLTEDSTKLQVKHDASGRPYDVCDLPLRQPSPCLRRFSPLMCPSFPVLVDDEHAHWDFHEAIPFPCSMLMRVPNRQQLRIHGSMTGGASGAAVCHCQQHGAIQLV